MMHIHELDGCAPAPLAHYLKALGILRLVAEQCDGAARGWWDGERFRLASTLDQAELEAFFLHRYAPTPFVSPWNKGSGFFQPNDAGLAPVEKSRAARLQTFRNGVAATRAFLTELATADGLVRAIKEESKAKALSKQEREALKASEDYKKRLAEAERRFKLIKAELIPLVSARWRGPHRDWIDTALVLDDTRTARFPALMGTGGNDGRLDFTNNFMQRLGDVFDLATDDASPWPASAGWLRAALWGTPTAGCLPDKAVGQFLPGNAGGANSANGAEGTSLLNPFDFILMMEGGRLFTANLVKRLDASGPQRAAAPFVVNAQAAGYASASAADESARGEQWMPLWRQPMTLAETRQLFSEGRSQIGRSSASQPLDMARAASRLGVARGITSFQRFGYIERNGQSNLAVPIGRFVVNDAPSPMVDCLDDVATWLSSVRRNAADKDGTARLVSAAKRIGDAAFNAAQHPSEPMRWQALLIALADVEAVMRTGSGFKAQPIPALRPEWVLAADDGSPEFRLALAFALQARDFRRDNSQPLDPTRRHWLPIEEKRGRTRFALGGDAMHPKLELRADVAMQGRSGTDDAVAMIERRLVEAARDGNRHFPLKPARRADGHIADLSAWLNAEADPDRTIALGRALMALNRGLWAEQWVHARPPAAQATWPDDGWLCIRLAHSPYRLPNGRMVPCDPSILRRLASGDAAAAVALAQRRLAACGLRSGLRAASVPAASARLWAAALAFPVSFNTAQRMALRLDPSIAQEQFA